MPSVTTSKSRRWKPSRRPAARWSAPCAIRSATADYASYLLQAQASGADIVGVANAGDDTVNSMKQAAEFGLTKKQKLVGVILGMNRLPALTLKAAQGAQIMNPFYWDMNEGTRSVVEAILRASCAEEHPNDMQAGVYASVIHYLKAIDKVGGAGRRQGRGRGDEGNCRPTIRCSERAPSAPTAARSIRCICSRSRSPMSRSRSGTC